MCKLQQNVHAAFKGRRREFDQIKYWKKQIMQGATLYLIICVFQI